MHGAQIGEAALGIRANEVECHRTRRISAQQTVGVRDARLRRRGQIVHGVAAVRRQTRDGLDVGTARLRELARHPADLHDRNAGGVGEDDRHLQERPELVPDLIGADAGERLRAVAALKEERLAPRHTGEPVAQRVAFVRHDKARRMLELSNRGGKLRSIRPSRLLHRHQLPPALRHAPRVCGSCKTLLHFG